VAAVNGDGCRELVFAIQEWLDAHPAYVSARDAALDPIATRADS
jgi:hypothetical protein